MEVVYGDWSHSAWFTSTRSVYHSIPSLCLWVHIHVSLNCHYQILNQPKGYLQVYYTLFKSCIPLPLHPQSTQLMYLWTLLPWKWGLVCNLRFMTNNPMAYKTCWANWNPSPYFSLRYRTNHQAAQIAFLWVKFTFLWLKFTFHWVKFTFLWVKFTSWEVK